jgi:general secretion pathway protein M
MNQAATLQKLLSRPPVAAASYLFAMTVLIFVIATSLGDVLARRAEVAASAAMLEQFEGRRPAGKGQVATIAGPVGSPFLEGATVTVAGAALLKRVTTAISRLGGNVLSSQIDLQGTPSRTGFLTIIASCEIEQPALQQLLYDIEAGLPFLFVEQLSVQAPASFAASDNGRLRVLLAVSGQWQGAKQP